MPVSISVEGTPILKEAFIKQLQSEGFEAYSDRTCEFILEEDENIGNIEDDDTLRFQATKTFHNTNHFRLPQQWDEALAKFKEIPWKVGDYAFVLRDEPYNHKKAGDVFMVTEISSNTLYFKVGASVSSSRCRKATSEEISKTKTKTRNIEVRFNGVEEDTFNVTINGTSISTEGEIGTIEELKLLVDLINPSRERKLKTWRVRIPYVSIGCKDDIHTVDLIKVVDAYNEING